MPNLNVEISEEMLKQIRLSCAGLGITQKQWVVDALKIALNPPMLRKAAGVAIEKVMSKMNVAKELKGTTAKVVVVEPDPLTQLREAPIIPGAKCEVCQFPVYEDRSGMVTKWKCTNPKKTHSMSPRKLAPVSGRMPEDFDPEDFTI